MRTFLPLFLLLQAVLGWDPSLLLCPALPNVPMPRNILTPRPNSAPQPGLGGCSKEHPWKALTCCLSECRESSSGLHRNSSTCQGRGGESQAWLPQLGAQTPQHTLSTSSGTANHHTTRPSECTWNQTGNGRELLKDS